jgi:carboxypeptidase PM20D1
VQRELLRRLAPHAALHQRVVLANLWLSAPLVARQLATIPASDATLRTTTAPTLFHAGVKDNVLAQQAEAVVNFRIRPGDSIDGVLAHVEAVIDDPSVEREVVGDFATEPTVPASWEDPLFLAIEDALRAVSPEPALIVAPYVTSGATDARHYAALTPRLFRFLPVRLNPELLASFHGNNERLPVEEYLRAVRFYLALLRGWSGSGAPPPSA